MIAGLMKKLTATGHILLSVLSFLTLTCVRSFADNSSVPPTVTVAATDAIATLDGSETGLITFNLSSPAPSDLTVNFALGGTAAKWSDYYRLPQGDMPTAVTIPAGASSASLPITARANSTGATPDSVTLTLTPHSSYAIGAASAATLNIVPGAPTVPTVSVAATNSTASLDGNETGLVTFSLGAPAPADLTVNFALGGSAAKWTDYFRLPQGDMPVAVTIPAGASSASLPITARGNSTGANPETVSFTLAPDSSYAIGAASSATLNIVPTGGTTASSGSGGTITASSGSSGGTTASSGSSGNTGSTSGS